MDNKIDLFLASHANKFHAHHLMELKSQLETLTDNQLLRVQSVQYKDPSTMLLISILIGSLGVDRFMLGQTGLGVLKLLTCGGCGIWQIIDWFSISNMSKDHNFQQFVLAAQ